MTWPEIWEGESVASRTIRILLTPAAWLYRLGWSAYLLIYKLGIKKQRRPHSPVICVGNLVVGGSGKTPVVIFIARLLGKLGYKVVISASGYGSPASEAAQVAPIGMLNPQQWGDEPCLIREELPDIPLIVGRRRVLAAELCANEFPGAVMLMDDGAQHMPLARDLTFIVHPPGRNRQCLPAGPYREPYDRFSGPFRGGRVVAIPDDFEALYSELTFEPEKPPRAALMCALGNPQSFADAVVESGIEIIQKRFLPDHDRLDSPNLFEGIPEGPIVVTLKDWVKLRERDIPHQFQIIVARRRAILEPEIGLCELLREVCG